MKAVYVDGAVVLSIDPECEVFLSGDVLKAVVNDKLDTPERATLERWLWKYRFALDRLQECKEDFGKRYWSVFVKRYGKKEAVKTKK